MRYHRSIIRNIIILVFGCAAISCNETKNNSNDPKAIADQHNDAKFNDSKEKDAEFVADLAEINLHQIELAKLAQKNGSNNEIKKMGKKMEEMHSKSLAELKKIAKAKSITIPDSLSNDGDRNNQQITNKTGADFDRSFCQRITEENKTAIKKCETASTEAADIEIKNWATKSLTELRTHLDQAMTCEEKYSEHSKSK